MELNKETTRKILEAIAECDRFIEKEEKRSADLRPAAVAQHLEFCKTHKAKLIGQIFNAAIANETDAARIAKVEMLREYFTNPDFRAAMVEEVARINKA